MLSVLLLEDIGLMFDAVSSAASAMAGRVRALPFAGAAADKADLTVFEGPAAVEQAAEDWQALEREGGATTPFQTFALAQAAAEVHVRRGETLRVAVVRHAGRPVVILPTVVGRQFGLKVARFLGDPLIQYGDALCEPGTAKRHIESAFAAAADPAIVDAIHLRKVRDDARVAPLLRKQATASNHEAAPFVDIFRGRDGAEESRKLKRARRKLETFGALSLDVTEGAAARRHLRDALALKRRWIEARRLPSSVIGDDQWESALERIADSGSLRVAILRVAGQPAAYEVALTAGNRWYAFIGAVADAFARHSPGHVQVADTIAWCRANSFASYDALAPADEAKRGYCCSSTAVADFSRAVRPAGHVLTSAVRLLPAAKALFSRLPAPLRRPILKLAGR